LGFEPANARPLPTRCAESIGLKFGMSNWQRMSKATSKHRRARLAKLADKNARPLAKADRIRAAYA